MEKKSFKNISCAEQYIDLKVVDDQKMARSVPMFQLQVERNNLFSAMCGKKNHSSHNVNGLNFETG